MTTIKRVWCRSSLYHELYKTQWLNFFFFKADLRNWWLKVYCLQLQLYLCMKLYSFKSKSNWYEIYFHCTQSGNSSMWITSTSCKSFPMKSILFKICSSALLQIYYYIWSKALRFILILPCDEKFLCFCENVSTKIRIFYVKPIFSELLLHFKIDPFNSVDRNVVFRWTRTLYKAEWEMKK